MVMLSLLKYGNPVLQTNELKSREGNECEDKTGQTILGDTDERKKRELLNKLLPPRSWVDDKHNVWVQSVSTTPSTLQDVISLQDALDSLLCSSQARQVGICPIREKIYVSCFEEVIREVTLDCVERGELLHRVKEDLEKRVSALKALYQSGLAFGMRKALLTADAKEKRRRGVQELSKAIVEKQSKLEVMKQKVERMKEESEAARRAAKVKHEEEVKEYTQMNDQLKNNLEALLAAPRR